MYWQNSEFLMEFFYKNVTNIDYAYHENKDNYLVGSLSILTKIEY